MELITLRAYQTPPLLHHASAHSQTLFVFQSPSGSGSKKYRSLRNNTAKACLLVFCRVHGQFSFFYFLYRQIIILQSNNLQAVLLYNSFRKETHCVYTQVNTLVSNSYFLTSNRWRSSYSVCLYNFNEVKVIEFRGL